jgi:hypothetical protein
VDGRTIKNSDIFANAYGGSGGLITIMQETYIGLMVLSEKTWSAV